MMFARLFVAWLVAGLLLQPGPALAHAGIVTTERTESTLLSDAARIHGGQKFRVAVHIKLQPGWHTYWKNPGDSGTPPEFAWTLPNGFTAGSVQYLAPDRLITGPLVDYGYSDDAYFLFEITPPVMLSANNTSILALKGEWLICKDICVPETANLSLVLPASETAAEPGNDAALMVNLVSKIPVPATQAFAFSAQGGDVRFDMPLNNTAARQIKTAQFFPATDGLITNAAEQKVSIAPDRLTFSIKQAEGALPKAADGLVSFFLTDGQRKDYEVKLNFQPTAAVAASAVTQETPASQAGTAGSIASAKTAILFAFLGGLILNLMPCVFPILSLKALAIAKKAKAHPGAVRAQGLAYAAGVIMSFIALAAILIVVEVGSGLAGWGFQMQSPVFVTLLAILLFLVSLNLSGFFELPVLLGNAGAGRDSTAGSFMTGILAVLVATPCTAPFMGPAIGFALTQSLPVILAVFASLGVGLAAPFLLISMFPRLVNMLPKPGAWMLTFKQFLAFPMYMSVVWLLWVLAREGGADAVGIVLFGMVLIAFALWLRRHDSTLARGAGILIAIVGIGLAVAIVYATPMAANSSGRHAGQVAFSQSGLAELRSQGKPVFVDATADWCITCKVNETVALSSQGIKQAFAQRHITYMVADWTKGDMDITRYLESFNRRGVPIYVYYPSHGEPVVLPQILTEAIVLKATQ